MRKLELDDWLQIVVSIRADFCCSSHQGRSYLEHPGAPQLRAMPWKILSFWLPDPTFQKETLPCALKLSHLGSLHPDTPWRGEKAQCLCFPLKSGLGLSPHCSFQKHSQDGDESPEGLLREMWLHLECFLLRFYFPQGNPSARGTIPQATVGPKHQPCAASTFLRALSWRLTPAGTSTKSRETHHCAIPLS